MQNVLPQQAGLTISHIVYEYGVIKDTQDAMLVHVQNEDAINGGYIFRSTDDWTGQPSNVVKKIKPASQLPYRILGTGLNRSRGQRRGSRSICEIQLEIRPLLRSSVRPRMSRV